MCLFELWFWEKLILNTLLQTQNPTKLQMCFPGEKKNPYYFLCSYLKSQVIVSPISYRWLPPSERSVGCTWKGPHLSIFPNPRTPVVHHQHTVSSLLPAYPQLPEPPGSSHSSHGLYLLNRAQGTYLCPLRTVALSSWASADNTPQGTGQATHPGRDSKHPELKKEAFQAKLISP